MRKASKNNGRVSGRSKSKASGKGKKVASVSRSKRRSGLQISGPGGGR